VAQRELERLTTSNHLLFAHPPIFMAKRLRSDSASSATSPPWTIFTRPTDQEDTASQDLSSESSYSKHVCLDPLNNEQTPSISCFLPPNCSGRPFASHEQFESHYIQTHSNRCHECGRNFPSLRFLDLHIAENHDPLTELKRERGDKTVCIELLSFFFLAGWVLMLPLVCVLCRRM